MDAKLFLTTTPAFYEKPADRKIRTISAYHPNLGLGYLQASVDNLLPVQSLDARQWNMTIDELVLEAEKRLEGHELPILGISANTHDIKNTALLAEAVRKQIPGVVTVVGGWGPSITPERFLSGSIDYAILGEGELPLINLLKGLISGTKPEGKAILSLADGVIVGDRRHDFYKDLDKLPFPIRDRHIETIYVKNNRMPIINIVGSRGCMSKCTFCYHPYVQKRYRERSPESIAEEVLQIAKTGDIRDTFITRFEDLTFLTSPDRIARYLDTVRLSGLNTVISGSARAIDIINSQDLFQDYKGSFLRIDFGGEALHDKTLKRWRKGQTVDDIVQAERILIDNGILYRIMMIGADEFTTVDDLREQGEQLRSPGLSRHAYAQFADMPVNLVNYADRDFQYPESHKAFQNIGRLYDFDSLTKIMLTPYSLQNDKAIRSDPAWTEVLEKGREMFLHAYDQCVKELVNPIPEKDQSLPDAELDRKGYMTTDKFIALIRDTYTKVNDRAMSELVGILSKRLKITMDPVEKASLLHDKFLVSSSGKKDMGNAERKRYMKDMRDAIRLDPQNLDYRMTLAGLYHKSNNAWYSWRIGQIFSQLSEEKLEPALRDPEFPFYLSRIADVDRKKAMRLLDKATSASPIGVMAPLHAFVLAGNDRYKEALDVLRKHLEFCPTSIYGWLRMGYVGSSMKDDALIEESYRRLAMLGLSDSVLPKRVYGHLFPPTQAQPL